MNEPLPLLGCLALGILGLPVWAIVSALRAGKQANENRARLETLTGRLDQLESRWTELRREPRSESAGAVPSRPSQAEKPAPPVERPVLPTAPPRAAAPDAPAPLQPPPPPPPPSLASPVPARQPAAPFDWESLISVRVFAWLGGGALFLGAALFLQYSIQHGLISPAARVAIGLVAGAIALSGGDWLRARAAWAGQAISGAGVAILYASLFAAHARYGLLSTTATFGLMALVTLTAGVVAVRRNAFVIAVLGLLGGFLTPYLLSTNEDHPIGLFGYVLLLDLGVVVVARRRGWLGIRLLALAATAVLYAGWAAAHLDAEKLPWALLAAALLAGLFASFRPGDQPDPRKRELARAVPILAAVAPLLLAPTVCAFPSLAPAPALLVADLLMVGAGAFLVSRRVAFAPLTALGAGLSVAALVFRAQTDLFPARRTETLVLFALVPAAYLALWVVRRFADAEPVLRVAAAITLLGGFPILLRALSFESTAEPVAPLWLFALAHAAGLLVVGALRFSGSWILASQGLLFAALLSLSSRFTAARLSEFLPLVAVATLAYWGLPFLAARFRCDHLSWWSSAASPMLHYPVLYAMARTAWGTDVLGAAAVLFGLAALGSLKGASVVLRDPADRRFSAALFGAVTLLFVTAAIPILLDKEWITVAWALEAAALAWLATRIPEDGLVKACAALAAAAFLRLVANPALWGYHPRSGTPIVNWYLYTFAVPAAVFLLAARWTCSNAWASRARLPEILRAAAGILLFVLVNVEIADFYSSGVGLTFRLSGGGLGEDMTYSLAWGVFGILLFFIGLTRASKATRAAALVVLLLTIAKVFLHDLWNLGALYRVGSIVGLAFALLAVSFLTQRFVLSREQP